MIAAPTIPFWSVCASDHTMTGTPAFKPPTTALLEYDQSGT